MKNMSLKVMSLAFIMTASSAAFADVNGGSGTIHFTGTVIDAPCSIAPESIEQTVELGSVALSSLKLRVHIPVLQPAKSNWLIVL